VKDAGILIRLTEQYLNKKEVDERSIKNILKQIRLRGGAFIVGRPTIQL